MAAAGRRTRGGGEGEGAGEEIGRAVTKAAESSPHEGSIHGTSEQRFEQGEEWDVQSRFKPRCGLPGGGGAEKKAAEDASVCGESTRSPARRDPRGGGGEGEESGEEQPGWSVEGGEEASGLGDDKG